MEKIDELIKKFKKENRKLADKLSFIDKNISNRNIDNIDKLKYCLENLNLNIDHLKESSANGNLLINIFENSFSLFYSIIDEKYKDMIYYNHIMKYLISNKKEEKLISYLEYLENISEKTDNSYIINNHLNYILKTQHWSKIGEKYVKIVVNRYLANIIDDIESDFSTYFDEKKLIYYSLKYRFDETVTQLKNIFKNKHNYFIIQFAIIEKDDDLFKKYFDDSTLLFNESLYRTIVNFNLSFEQFKHMVKFNIDSSILLKIIEEDYRFLLYSLDKNLIKTKNLNIRFLTQKFKNGIKEPLAIVLLFNGRLPYSNLSVFDSFTIYSESIKIIDRLRRENDYMNFIINKQLKNSHIIKEFNAIKEKTIKTINSNDYFDTLLFSIKLLDREKLDKLYNYLIDIKNIDKDI